MSTIEQQRAEIQAALDHSSNQLREYRNQTQAEIQALQQVVAGLSARSSGVCGGSDEETGVDATLRDQQGNPVGVLLAAKDLRNIARVRAHIGTLKPQGATGDMQSSMRLTEFMRGVAGMRSTASVQAALSEGTNSTGGYAVPSVLLPGILSALAPASSLIQAGANVAVLDTPADSFKVAAVDTLPTAAWRDEAASLSESDPTFRGITIVPRSLAFLFKVSRELLQDAPGMEQALSIAIAAAFAKALDRTALYGSGAAPTPEGLKFTNGVNVIDHVGALSNYRPFVAAMRAIKEANAPIPTAAIVSTREDETIANFADTTGQPLRRPDALAGWQFIANSQIPIDEVENSSDSSDAADDSDAFVGDFTGFTFYMREAVSIQLLREKYADTGQIGFACHVRADCAAAYPKAFAVLEGIAPSE